VHRRRLVAWTCLAAALGACLFPDLSVLTSRADAGDAGSEAGDAAGDGPTTTGVLANAGHVTGATGNATQTHIVYALGSKRWWLFYIDDDPMTLKTRSSPDFVTWTDGATLTLAHTNAGEGRNFSVAYASRGGTDVVHVVLSHVVSGGSLVHAHARAVITNATIAFSAPADVSMAQGSLQGPDGPVTFIDADGTVWDASGFAVSMGTTNGHYNEDVFSAAPDNGASWTSGFTQQTLEVVNTVTNAHALFNANGMGAVWTLGDQTNPTNLRFSTNTGSWSSAISIFDAGAEDSNDWSVAVLTTTKGPEGHVVRALLGGGYEHVYGGSGTGSNTAAPLAQSRTAGSGVLLLADPSHLAALDVAADGSLVMSRWDPSATSWSPWTVLASATPRAFLSGYCPDLDAHPEAKGCAVLWTSTTTSGSTIGGQLVTVR
jgi:hypothetical protein